MIDVIIPVYNSKNTIFKTLSSIAFQSIKSLCNIIIVNDNSEYDYKELIDFFNNYLNIKELKLEKNSGPGVARQYGIDNSNSEYIVFIDSDDLLFSYDSLEKLCVKIKENNYDIVSSDFLEESNNKIHSFNTTWLFGKIFSRKFIIDNNIKFNSERVNEDLAFNNICYFLFPKCEHIYETTYIWSNNINSITRSNYNKYEYERIESFIYNMNYALEDAISRKKYDTFKVSKKIFQALVYSYFWYLKFHSRKDSKDKIKGLKEIYLKSLSYNLDDNEKNIVIEFQKEQFLEENKKNIKYIQKSYISLDKFMKMVEGLK